MLTGCFLHFILRYRFRASVCPTEQISPTPVTVQVSSLQGFGWDCWPHCSCSTFSCTVCTWSCSWTRWIDSMTLKVHRFQCLSQSEELTHTKHAHFSVLQCLLINHGLRRVHSCLVAFVQLGLFLWICSLVRLISSLIFPSEVLFPEPFYSCLWDIITLEGTFQFISPHVQVPKLKQLHMSWFWVHVLKDVSVPDTVAVFQKNK